MSAQKLLIVAGVVLGCLGFCCSSCCNKQSEYARPESFILDPDTGAYYVSNVSKFGETEAANDGYITKLDKDLNIVEQKFIQGTDKDKLNDPKGLAIIGDTLWVADNKVMHAYDKTTGKTIARISLQELGARSLNGLDVGPDGLLFVSDDMSSIIFTINTKENNTPEVFMKGPELSSPNGLYWDDAAKLLYVACWAGSKVLKIDLEHTVTTYVADANKLKNLDGLDGDGKGNLYLSDFTKNTIWRITPEGRLELVTDKVTTPADIHVDRAHKRLLIPEMSANKTSTYNLAEEQ
jgi:DNA-binding beta-propeller fold protein YncE